MHEQCKQMCDAQFLTYSTKSKHILIHYDSIPADHLNQTNVPVAKVVELKDHLRLPDIHLGYSNIPI